jgi:hypothetical protein
MLGTEEREYSSTATAPFAFRSTPAASRPIPSALGAADRREHLIDPRVVPSLRTTRAAGHALDAFRSIPGGDRSLPHPSATLPQVVVEPKKRPGRSGHRRPHAVEDAGELDGDVPPPTMSARFGCSGRWKISLEVWRLAPGPAGDARPTRSRSG